MSELIHLIYVSKASHDFVPEELHKILDSAHRNNANLSITGMLLHVDGHFFQVLEGKESKVNELYQRIEADNRHINSLKLLQEEIEERAFPNWSMGHVEATKEELDAIEGLNDFFSDGNCLMEIKSGQAMTLIHAFQHGKWRRD